MRWVALLGILAGCDIVLGLEVNPALPPEPPEAGTPGTCDGGRMPRIQNNFATDVEMLSTFYRHFMEGPSGTVDGQLVVTTATPIGAAAIATSDPMLDFSNATAQVRIVGTISGPNAESYMTLNLDNNQYYYFSVNVDLAMDSVTDQLDPAKIPYDKQAHAFIRFRHDPGPNFIVFETSIDSVIWAEKHRLPVSFDLRMAQVRLGAAAYPPGRNDVTNGKFDEFLLCR